LWSMYTGTPQAGLGSKLSTYNAGTFQAGGAGSAAILALATGICAGIGEETLIRGALQPVFGIFPAAFLHGALHGQFQHAPLLILQVAGWSTMMGIVRKYTNTTTTIITHATFNFLTTFLFAFNP
jgi:membrane protease YdiL (CAAX protease family)